MKTQVEQTGECEATLTVEAEAEILEGAMKRAARKLADRASIPGFRKGKAPYSVVISHLGQQAVFDEAVDLLGPEVYRKALDESGLSPARAGTLEDIVSREPLVLKFTVPLQPEVALGDYRQVRVPFALPPMPAEDVERMMENLRQSQTILEPVSRPAQEGDVLVAKVQVQALDSQGKLSPLPAAMKAGPDDQSGEEVELSEDVGGRFPGAGAAIFGIREGESREIEFTYPEAFPVSTLQGVHARLFLTCLAVKARRVPEWSEDLVKSVSEYSTVEELQAGVRTSLEAKVKRDAEGDYASRVIDQMIQGGSVRYPNAILREEIDKMVKSLARSLEREGVTLDTYLKGRPEGRPGLEKELEPRARERLTRGLYLADLAQKEQLEVPEGDVDQRVRNTLASVQSKADPKQLEQMLRDPALHEIIYEDLLNDRVVERIIAIGKGEAPPLQAHEDLAPAATVPPLSEPMPSNGGME
ncbi:MAG: trigger factor [Anaerolineales bacterium]|jgi:trigger factor